MLAFGATHDTRDPNPRGYPLRGSTEGVSRVGRENGKKVHVQRRAASEAGCSDFYHLLSFRVDGMINQTFLNLYADFSCPKGTHHSRLM